MKQLWNSFKIGFSMYSKIPMPKSDWNKEKMKYAICFFPLIGVVIGGLIVLWFYIQERLPIGNTLSTIIYIIIPIIVTGGIHLDGLLDTSDALSSYQPRERKLEILKDSNAGAFAVIVCVVYMLLSFGIWSEVSNRTVWVLAVGFVISRALSGFGVVSLRLAKNTGLVAVFSDAAAKKKVRIVMAIYILLSTGVLLSIHFVLGTVCLLSALSTFLYYRYMAYKQFGGITGDLAGFFLQGCELVMAIAVVGADILLRM